MAEPVLKAHDVWKSYDGRSDVLRGVSLAVDAGDAILDSMETSPGGANPDGPRPPEIVRRTLEPDIGREHSTSNASSRTPRRIGGSSTYPSEPRID